ncbi:MAG TPA: contractile injection system tape measure protein, partial [Puia sp.]|nr:contractile injection system tape measure protein [Puia sp.]
MGYGNGYAPWAIGRLVRRADIGWMHSLRAMNVLGGEICSRLELLLNARDAGNKTIRMQGKAEIREILNKLNVLQLALLLHAGRVGQVGAVTGRELSEVPVSGGGDELPGRQVQGATAPDKMLKSIALAIAKRAGAKGTGLYEQLMRWPGEELRSLHRKWERDAAGRAALKKIRAGLRDHPCLENYPLLDLVTEMAGAGKKPGEKGLNEILSSGTADDLTANRKITGGSTADPVEMQDASVPRKNLMKKKTLAKALKELPERAIRILDHLTGLPEKELQELLSPVPPIATIYSREQEETGRILIDNAGLCLFAPYLPGFFKNLGYMDKDGFKDFRFAARAVHLLQYIAVGKRKAPEYLLAFPKLLCGLPAGKAIPGSLRLKKSELAEADDLISAIIHNWKALKNSSADGLRGSFLCRKGIITDKGAQLVLQVERKEYDILLNGISWGYSIIKMPWMAKYIEVQW